MNKAFENQLVHVGGYQFTMAQYYEYADEAGDEMPLYLFDKRFAEKSPRLAEDYHVPQAFSEDLFGVLGDCRPDYRWLIVGPKRSGSSFHKDPKTVERGQSPEPTGTPSFVLAPAGSARRTSSCTRDQIY